MTLTDKQKDIIKTINLGHERGHLLDLDELLEVLPGNDSNLLIVFYGQIMPDDFVMQLHRF